MPENNRPPRYQPYAPLGDPHRARLGDLVAHRKSLTLFCSACLHWSSVDPASLARRVGYDRTLSEVMDRAKCRKCGGRQVQVKVREDQWGR
jgi:hypothetical protein